MENLPKHIRDAVMQSANARCGVAVGVERERPSIMVNRWNMDAFATAAPSSN